MDATTANAIVEYKEKERRARRLLLNALKLRIEAQRIWAEFDALVEQEIKTDAEQAVANLYTAQLAVNPATVQALGAIDTNLAEDWQIMVAMQTADDSVFFGGVPALPEEDSGDGELPPV